MSENTEKLIGTAEKDLERILEWIGRHDTRVAFIAGIVIGMLGVLGGIIAQSSIDICEQVFALLAGAGLIFSLVYIYRCQYPDTESPNSSLIFFGTVAALNFQSFQQQYRERTSEDYLNDLLHQIHINAKIMSKKFSHLKTAMTLLLLSSIPWAITIYLVQL